MNRRPLSTLIFKAILLAILPATAAIANPTSPSSESDPDDSKGTPTPVTETIMIRGVSKPIKRVVHNDQIAVHVPTGESAPKIPKNVTVSGVTLVLIQESNRWENMAVYQVPKGPLTGDEQLRVSRALETNYKWAATAGPAIRSADGRPHVLLQRLVVEFKQGVSDKKARALHRQLGADKIKVDRLNPSLYTVEFKNRPIIELFRIYANSDSVRWVAPDMILPCAFILSTSVLLTPWHHDNVGAGSDVIDADVDSEQAWAITPGDDSIVVAIIDQGFERAHPEFTLWTNAAEEGGMPGIDEDGNGLDDDIYGFDFDNNDPDVNRDAHGTKAAGCVGAKGENGYGISGICPRSKLMLLQAVSLVAIREAIQYATCEGADVICIPRYQIPIQADLEDAVCHAVTNGRGGKGCAVCCALEFAMGSNELTDLPTVIAVRDTSPQDELARTLKILGRSMSVLAPGKRIATTNMTSVGSYGCFAGSSAATPVVSGAIALVLSARADLTWRQVRRLMQDTCDKIDPVCGNYGPSSGYSEPAEFSTHGFGRINVFEAVRLVAPCELGGKNGVDLFLRDQIYDWGNTERPSNILFNELAEVVSDRSSPDIKIDSGPCFHPQPTTSVAFDDLPDELPLAGQPARIYVRVRNRGLAAVSAARVRVFSTPGPNLPPMPIGADGAILPPPAGGDAWTLVGEATVAVEYSGCSVAGDLTKDKAAIVQLDWPCPPANITTLLAVVDCDGDPLTGASNDVNLAVPSDNNLALKRYGAVVTAQ